MKVKVVIGANYGDEGKGLVSGNLAALANGKTLTVFYNGTMQRCHTFLDVARQCTAAGTAFGSDTYYHPKFVVDPITLWLKQETAIIDPNCRLIIPCDVASNRNAEINRGNNRHGSCGFGLFAAVKRSVEDKVPALLLKDPYALYKKLYDMREKYPYDYDMIYNLDNFMKAADYIRAKCDFKTFDEIAHNYDNIIYEGAQGLLLDQSNMHDFPHLTPSSVGIRNIAADIKKLGCVPELFYVSRTYMTRHGNGPMEDECDRVDINDAIVDRTNLYNKWQGQLRFGRINLDTLYTRVKKDANEFNGKANINLVFTQLNYTDNKLETIEGRKEIIKPDFCSNIYVSNDKQFIHLMEK